MDGVIRRDTLLDELKSDEDNGAAIHSFDPNASPEAKAASAGKAKVNLQPTNNVQEGRGEPFPLFLFHCFLPVKL